MKKATMRILLLVVLSVAVVMAAGCSRAWWVPDTDKAISEREQLAIEKDQLEVEREQLAVLGRIATALEEIAASSQED